MQELSTQPLQIPQINLLSRFRTQLLIRAKRQLYIQLICTFFLVLFGLSWLGVSIYKYVIHREIQTIDTQVSTLTKKIEDLVEFESKYIVLKRKAQTLVAVSQTARKHQQLVEDLFILFPDELSVDSFSISDAGEINFEAQTADPTQLHAFLNTLSTKTQLGDTAVKRISLSRITVNSEGKYSVGVLIQLV